MKFYSSLEKDFITIPTPAFRVQSRQHSAKIFCSFIRILEENKNSLQAKLNISLVLGFIVIGFSCQQSVGRIAEDVVYYYPEKNIYYDSQLSRYYYSLDGARSWDSMNYKSTSFGQVLGPRFSIQRSSDKIWQKNELHRQEYKGVLLNVINERTIQLAREDSANKNRKPVIAKTMPKPVEKETETIEEPVQRGLKKFFNKLFGKKKKPAEEKSNKLISQ
ncbi:MAG: hypothetical protein ABIN94_15915 [Ferruginibacter sp.]